MILDVEKGEASRVFPEEFDRICLAHHSPIDIHLKEHVLRIGVLKHIFIDDGVLDLFELV